MGVDRWLVHRSAQPHAAPHAPPRPGARTASTDRHAGRHAIEVTTIFEDTVLGIRHLDDPAGAPPTALTHALIALGALLALGALALALAGRGGVGALLLPAAAALAVHGALRRLRERPCRDFIVGAGADADLNLAHPTLPSERFPLVHAEGRGYALLVTRRMDGDVTLGDERIALGRLADSDRVRPAPEHGDAFAFPIPPGARIKLDLGATTLLVHSVAPAQPLPSALGERPDWLPTFGLSAAAHLLLLLFVFALPPDAKALSLDLFEGDSELIEYRIQRRERREETLPPWITKPAARPPGAGAPATRQRGAEGSSGTPNVPRSRRGRLVLPADGPALEPAAIRAEALAQAQRVGVLGILGSNRGGALASVFAMDSALGPKASAVWGSLSGALPGEADGENGLGLRGTGRHGGGDAVGIGVGRLHTIGAHGRGGEPGDYGGAVAQLASHTASTPRAQTGAIAVHGGLDKALVRRAIRQHLNAIRYCYSRALLTNHQLEGRVSVEFAIAADGKVATAKILTSTLADAAAEQCITAAIRRIVFPKPPQGDLVIVSYPFVLRAPGS